MAGFAGFLPMQRHVAPPRTEEAERMAAALGPNARTLVEPGIAVATDGVLHRIEEPGRGWVVAVGPSLPEAAALLERERPEEYLTGWAGPFAVAAWDARNRRLLMARDRYGLEPLYLTTAGGRFGFATRVEALQAGLGQGGSADAVGLDQLFTLGAPVPPRTVFSGIEQLPPGQWMVVDVTGARSAPFAAPLLAPGRQGAGEAAGALEGALAGVEGVAALDGWLGAPLERAAARRGLPRLLPPDGGERGDLEWAVGILGRPVVDPAPLQEAALARGMAGREESRVALAAGGRAVRGEGAFFRELALRRGWARQPESPLRAATFGRLAPERPGSQLCRAGPDCCRALYGAGLDTPSEVAFACRHRWLERSRIRTLLAEGHREALMQPPEEELLAALPADFASWSGHRRARHLALLQELGSSPGALLRARGVEVRYPWLDPAVVSAM
ncbi:MAG: hypothetical protein ACLFTX_03485, partial [Thiohalospira sp.]